MPFIMKNGMPTSLLLNRKRYGIFGESSDMRYAMQRKACYYRINYIDLLVMMNMLTTENRAIADILNSWASLVSENG